LLPASQASVDNLTAQIAAQQAKVDQANKQVMQAQAALTFARQQADRYQQLASRGSGTVEQAQQYASNMQQSDAGLAAAQANATATEKQIGVLQAQRDLAYGQLAQAHATLEQAEANLARTIITAPVAGQVTKLTAAKGGYAAVGQALMMFVPREVWVTGNFKETQLNLMRPGQPVDITIDAYPFAGHVDSVQSGSGTAFSLPVAGGKCHRQLRQDRATRCPMSCWAPACRSYRRRSSMSRGHAATSRRSGRRRRRREERPHGAIRLKADNATNHDDATSPPCHAAG
jgi:multidrug resistance efflux pump